jgi:hypothetical protein
VFCEGDNEPNEDSQLQFEQGCFGQFDGASFNVHVIILNNPLALNLRNDML